MLSRETVGAVIEGYDHKDLRILDIVPENKKKEFLDQEFVSIKGRKITSVNRRGKYILINLGTPTLTLLVHFSFNGWIIPTWAGQIQPRRFIHKIDLDKYEKFTLLTDRGRLTWVDSRILSRTRFFLNEAEALKSNYLKYMGPDADTPEAYRLLFKQVFNTSLNQWPVTEPSHLGKPYGRRSGRRIRDLLMDQRFICGIGNYLVCEILHRAGLHGAEKVRDLTIPQVQAIVNAIPECINLAQTEDTHDWWRVFQRKETPDGHPVTREAWGVRGHYVSYYHQPPPSGYEAQVNKRDKPTVPQ